MGWVDDPDPDIVVTRSGLVEILQRFDLDGPYPIEHSVEVNDQIEPFRGNRPRE